MKLLPGIRGVVTLGVQAHNGGWDEILMFFGAPVTLFVLLRWLGLRKERREAAAAGEDATTKHE